MVQRCRAAKNVLMRPAQQAIIDEFEVRPRIDPAAELGLRYDDIDDHRDGREVPVEVAEKIETVWWRT